MYIFICIGSTKLSGDSLGPIIGSYLKKKYKNSDFVKIYGDMDNQVDFHNIENILKEIETIYHNRCIKIIIDSALGNQIGNVMVSDGEIFLGKGLNKEKKITGDISIIGIVGKDYKDPWKNFLELKKIKKYKILQMAKYITEFINIYRYI